jgi:hypothetical protein
MKQLLAFSVIILLLLAPSCKWLRKKGFIGRKGADTMAVWKVRQDSLRVSDSLRTVQEMILAREKARLDSLSQADRERSEWESRYRYNIIVGSFITPEYARACSADYTSRGYQTRIIPLEGTRFEMVSAEAHESFSRAVERLKAYQDTVAYDAWLYVFRKQN